MQKAQFKNLSYLMAALVLVSSSCKNGLSGKKKEASSMTGWAYNDSKQGGFNVAKPKDVKLGPNQVFVQGGTFTMGATEEDVMGDWNNTPKRVTVNSFTIDKTEVANVHYREYMYWLDLVFSPSENEGFQSIVDAAKPDTLVWRSELAYNEPYVDYYFRHPSYNYYPVVGVTWKQAHDFCLWRTDRANEYELWKRGLIKKDNISGKKMRGSGANGENGENIFNTKAYLLGMGNIQADPKAKTKKNPLTTPDGKPRTRATFEDGILFPEFRLPTEAEWEYAALALIAENPQKRTKEKNRGEELVANKQTYSWKNYGYDNLRDVRHGSWQGSFLANFKRGFGDNMGVAGGLNDRSAIPGPIESFYPNAFGIYNMSGNVSEWVGDVYRPLTNQDGDDFNYYRGNKFQKLKIKDPKATEANEKYERDSLGRLVMIDETPEDLKNRRNYQTANAMNYLDGDSLSQVTYGYGVTTLVSDSSRVVKGGSWNDRPYWLSPGARRFLEQNQASSTIGFRCAMTYFGATEGAGRKTGNNFPARRNKR
jgi:formylglycine-generating enzyme